MVVAMGQDMQVPRGSLTAPGMPIAATAGIG
jgi:hypothetical protein